MIKKYIRLGIILIILFLILLSTFAFVLTSIEAEYIKNQCVGDLYKAWEMGVNPWEDMADSIEFDASEYDRNTTVSTYIHYKTIHDKDFYSMVKNPNGDTIAEYKPFMDIYSYVEEDHRIIVFEDEPLIKLLDQSTSFGGFSSFPAVFEVTGTCDDSFIYPEKIMWIDRDGIEYIYEPTVDCTHKGDRKFEEWAGSTYYLDEDMFVDEYYADIDLKKYNMEQKSNTFEVNNIDSTYYDWFRYTTGFRKQTLEDSKEKYDEAKKFSEKVYDNYLKTGLDSYTYSDVNLTVVGSMEFLEDGCVIVYTYVFHPLEEAVANLGNFYILLIIIAVVFLHIIGFVIYSLCRQHYVYEKNRKELTSAIAHELKTPLAITKGYIENWQYFDEEDRKKQGEVMIEEIENMDKIVVDLLELSRLEIKAKKLDLESVDIHALSLTVLRPLELFIKEKNVDVTIHKNDKDKALVLADLALLRVVLSNFIVNAVKYSERKIDITIKETVSKVRFEITNDGLHISEEHLGKIWDTFYKVKRANQSRLKSSGIGLAITKNILELHKAQYGCKSENLKTTFWFEMKKDNSKL